MVIEHNYVVSAFPKVKASDSVIIGTILFCDHMSFILYDPEYTFSYSLKFA